VAASVVSRRGEAVFVPFCKVGMRGAPGEADWEPQPKHYHANVAAWVSRCPQHKHIRGYGIFDLRLLYGVWQVHAHSVVELEDGRLIDITPSGVSQLYPFVRHLGTDEEFEAMADAMRVNVVGLTDPSRP
jgi:hypothetical protein